MVNFNMVNSKFYQFQVNLTGIQFEVALIQTINLKYFLILNYYKVLIRILS